MLGKDRRVLRLENPEVRRVGDHAVLHPSGGSRREPLDQLLAIHLAHVRIRDDGVGGPWAVLRDDRAELIEQARSDEDVVGGIPLFDQRDANGHHGISSWPVCMFTARASTNSRSDRLFRYWMITGLTGWLRASVTTERSARRQTVRATWSAAAFGDPPGRMKFFKGLSFGS